MKPWQVDTLAAATYGDIHCEDLSDLINLVGNVDRYQLLPAYSEKQYGEFLLEMEKDNSGEIFERLEQSENRDEREFAQYVLRLEKHVDLRAYGRSAANEENGLFTRHGYLVEQAGFQTVYHGLEDIPREYRVFSDPPPLLMVEGADIPAFLTALHAVAGDYSRDVEYNLGVLSKLKSSEYLLLMDGKAAFLTETAHAYRRGTTEFNAWMNAVEKPGMQGFAFHLTQVHGEITGNVVQIDINQRQLDILHNSIHPVKIEATMKDGSRQDYSPGEWEALSPIEKDRVQDWRREFQEEDYAKVNHHLDDLRGNDEENCKPADATRFLADANASYMHGAQHPEQDMLRISQTAAKEMLARGDGEVFRLLPNGPEQLSPTDAVKSGLWFSEHREFAIRREDGNGLQRWSERSAQDIMSRAAKGRDEQSKTHGPEL